MPSFPPTLPFVLLLTAALSAQATPPPLTGAPKVLGTPLRVHGSDASGVTWSADGKLAASAGWDGCVRVYDAATGKRLAEARTDTMVTDVRFCGPKSERLVALLWKAGLGFFDPKTGKQTGTLAGKFQFFTVSPDGATIATGRGGALVLVDAVAGTERGTILVSEKPKAMVDAQCWSPDGKQLVAHDLLRATAWLVEVGQGKVLASWQWPSMSTQQAFLPDGKTLLVVGRKALHRVAVPEGKVEQSWTLPVTPVCVRPLASGTQAVIGDADGAVDLFDLGEGKVVKSFLGHDESIMRVALSPDGSTLLTASTDDSVRFLRMADLQDKFVSPAHNAMVSAVAFASDGKTLWSSSNDHTAVRWGRDGKLLHKSALHADGVTAVAIAADQSCWTAGKDNTVRRRDVAGKELAKIALGEQDAHVQSLALDQGGALVVTGHADGSVRWYDASTGALMKKGSGHEAPAVHLCTAGDGSFVASAGDDGSLVWWDPATAEPRHKVMAHEGGVTGLVRLADGGLVTSGLTRELKRWDASGKETAKVLVSDRIEGAIGALGLLPAHGLVVAASADALRFFSVDGLQPAGEKKGLPGKPTCLAVAGDGSLMAIGMTDATVALWAVTSPTKSQPKK